MNLKYSKLSSEIINQKQFKQSSNALWIILKYISSNLVKQVKLGIITKNSHDNNSRNIFEISIYMSLNFLND
jgi:hypothetical protein